MRITALMENTAVAPKFRCDAALSLYIETEKHKILFDAGGDDGFADNASELGIDLSQVDIAFLSHGHSDHSNGLMKFFELNDHVSVYAHVGYELPHFSTAGGFIGVSEKLHDNPRIIPVSEDRIELGDGITILDFSKEKCLHEIENWGMAEERGGVRVPEVYSHEQYMIVREGNVNLLLTGCCHKGIGNVMYWARNEHITHVVGGFHLKPIQKRDFDSLLLPIACELLKYPVYYWTCHCTGEEQYEYLRALMGGRINYLSSGATVEI